MTRGFLHSHSYTGNPLACRAALATLDLFETADVFNENRRKSSILSAGLKPLADHPNVRNLRERGTIFAFDALIEDASHARTFSRRFFENALKQELLLRPIGTTVYLMPPYVLDDEELALLAERTRSTFEATLAEAA
jgi:adenosylmethionine-8-amino-7-oxononanoate aminotransferase